MNSVPGMQKEPKNPRKAANPYNPNGSQGAKTCVSIMSGDINPPIVHIAIPNEIAFDLQNTQNMYKIIIKIKPLPYSLSVDDLPDRRRKKFCTYQKHR